MREWIQTGVTIVAAAAVIVGVAFIGIMMARLGTANEAMRAAMEQVAASNAAMMEAMEQQREGNEALIASLSNLPRGAKPAPALELSTIDLVLRRGSEEGPPAPEITVWLGGKGANDERMTVRVESDADGRAQFEKLYQGSYDFRFHDPVSRLSAEDTITLFAGRGAGEHVIVVPDVEPRAVHLELELPAYGRDEEQLIRVDLDGTWEADEETRGIVWRTGGTALLGHFGTWSEPSELGLSPDWPLTVAENGNANLLEPFYIAGEVSLDEVRLLARQPDGTWGGAGRPRTRRASNETAIMRLERSRGDDTGEFYALKNSAELVKRYSSTARFFRSREHVTDNTYESISILRDAATVLEDRFVVDAGGPLKQRMAGYRDGQFFESDPGDVGVHSNYYGDDGIARVTLLTMPEPTAFDSGSDGSVYLALPLEEMKKHDLDFGLFPPDARPSTRRSLRMRAMDDLAGNTLAAYAIRAPWDGVAFPAYDGESEVGGLSLDVDAEPFWRFSSEALEAGQTVNRLFLPLPAELLADGGAPATGVLLRWENDTQGYYWALELGGGHSWVVTNPLPSPGDAGNDRPLDDLDGRFHYDGLRKNVLESSPPRPSHQRPPADDPAPQPAEK